MGCRETVRRAPSRCRNTPAYIHAANEEPTQLTITEAANRRYMTNGDGAPLHTIKVYPLPHEDYDDDGGAPSEITTGSEDSQDVVSGIGLR